MSLYLVIAAFVIALVVLNLIAFRHPPTEEKKREIEADAQTYSM